MSMIFCCSNLLDYLPTNKYVTFLLADAEKTKVLRFQLLDFITLFLSSKSAWGGILCWKIYEIARLSE